ncbi:MAG: cytochrome P450 [Thermoleophilia bacterium]|nr:cytochrome P450 [Thermoleophilia bacterium]
MAEAGETIEGYDTGDAAMSTTTLPPGPGSPPAVQILNWLFRPIAFLDSCRERYGESFSLTFPGFETPMVIISNPDHVAALFKERENGLPPGRTLALEPILGSRSILLLEGSEHLARRKVMLPPFHGERMRAYEDQIEAAIGREIDSWPLDTEFPLHPRMQAVTLEVILNAVFGVSDESRRARLRPLLANLLDQTAGPSLQVRFLLSRRISRMKDPLAELRTQLLAADELIALEAAQRRDDPNLESRSDILSMLVAARFEDGEPMGDSELRDQLMTLLLAGHETTATALAWTFDLLLRNPEQLRRLRREVREGEDDLYLRATTSEALRLRPVVPLAGRRLTHPLEIDGRELPPGTDVAPAIWLTHTRPESYPDPLAFRPERFLEDGPETYSWIPFGGGVRRCLGAAFAEFEMRVVLRAVLSRCEIEGTRSKPERITRRNVTFSPKRGTPVRVRSRHGARAERSPAPA